MAVTIRDVLTAEITRQYETTFLVDQGLLKDDRVYLAGRSEDGEHDGGVWWAMAGESAAFEPLIAPVIDPAPGAGMWTRLPLVVSPSGSTLGTTVCVQSGCFTQLVDTTSGIVSTIEDAYLSWLSDTTAVLIDGKELRAYSVADSAATWELTTQGDYYGGFFLADEATLIETSTEDGGDDYRYEIAAIAGESGDRVVILALEDPELSDYRLIPALSTHRYAVLLSDFTVEAALGSGDPEIVRIVDLETGALLPDLFVFVTE